MHMKTKYATQKFLCFLYISTLTNNQPYRQYLQHARICRGTGKEGRLAKQHNAPTHLPTYCIFRLVELSCAQFDYMQYAEMKVSNQQEIRTWNHLL